MTSYTELPTTWIDWIAENRSLGVAESDISGVLRQNGFNPEYADNHNQVATVDAAGPQSRKQKLLMDIYSDLWSSRPGQGSVDRCGNLSTDQFFGWHYAGNRPVVLTDAMREWPALRRWSPEYFRAYCGAEMVEVMTGRGSDPEYEINSEKHKTRMRMDQYVQMIHSSGATNDFYMVANNRSLETGAMRTLLNDIRSFPGILDPSDTAGKIFLWFGPDGTVTPLHHDAMNVLLAQVVGRKKVTLIPSFQTHLMYNQVGVYSRVNLEAPDFERFPLFRNVSRMEVILEPGEALFIPVGWWHHVRSLDVSVSVSFTNFTVPNTYSWNEDAEQ